MSPDVDPEVLLKILAISTLVLIALFIIVLPLAKRFVGSETDKGKSGSGLKALWRYIKTGEKDPDDPFLNS